jgi:hypothetical protein
MDGGHSGLFSCLEPWTWKQNWVSYLAFCRFHTFIYQHCFSSTLIFCCLIWNWNECQSSFRLEIGILLMVIHVGRCCCHWMFLQLFYIVVELRLSYGANYFKYNSCINKTGVVSIFPMEHSYFIVSSGFI